MSRSITIASLLIVLLGHLNYRVIAYSFDDEDYSCYHANSWRENVNKSKNAIFGGYIEVIKSHYLSPRRRLHGSMVPTPVTDVLQTVTSTLSSGWQLEFKGIPKYSHVMTADDITTLNARPKASVDFTNGATSASAGTTYQFGSDIGYNSDECAKGYFPPGPDCPVGGSRSVVFPLTPKPEGNGEGCYTGPVAGYFVNGIPFHSWSNGRSYHESQNWYEIAIEWNKYELDICLGMSKGGEYHHYSYSPCLASDLGDTGQGHSPIYGFAFDGYPVFGPYQAANTLAQSCWIRRDYTDMTRAGCSDAKRTCIMNDPTDYAKGMSPASHNGPAFTSVQQTLTANSITTSVGVYFEDHYFDKTCSGLPSTAGVYLDEHNGHDHGDGMGYHYHTTIDSYGKPVFPYIVGPRYYGCLPSGSGLLCGLNYTYNAVARGGEDTSTCLAGSAMSLSSQQCLDHNFDITSSSTDDGRLLSPAGRLGVLIGIIVVLLILVGLGLYCCCGKADDGSNYKTVPVQSTWNQNEYELQAYDNH